MMLTADGGGSNGFVRLPRRVLMSAWLARVLMKLRAV